MPVRDIKPVPKLTPDEVERFLRYVPKDLPGDACWPWMGGKILKGLPYGRFCLRGTTFTAHRVAYRLKSGDSLKNFLALHTCDNPPCVNWRHLFKGTAKDNSQDRDQKGRGKFSFHAGHKMSQGLSNHKAALTEEQVAQIRQRWPSGKTTADRRGLAQEFGVSLCTVYNVASGRSWTHIK